jgi:hypothetical protein
VPSHSISEPFHNRITPMIKATIASTKDIIARGEL